MEEGANFFYVGAEGVYVVGVEKGGGGHSAADACSVLVQGLIYLFSLAGHTDVLPQL